jgi:hypothetical protein
MEPDIPSHHRCAMILPRSRATPAAATRRPRVAALPREGRDTALLRAVARQLAGMMSIRSRSAPRRSSNSRAKMSHSTKLLLLLALLLSLDACQNPSRLQAVQSSYQIYSCHLEECLLLAPLRPPAMSGLTAAFGGKSGPDMLASSSSGDETLSGHAEAFAGLANFVRFGGPPSVKQSQTVQ